MSRHAFVTSVAEFEDGSLQAVAYCRRCTLIVPVGVHFLHPCVAAPRPSFPTDDGPWPSPPRGVQ